MTDKTTTRQPMGIKWGHAFVPLSVFLLAYVIPLGVRNLFVPDEARYAEIPREMIADGDWVIPHLNGLRYFEKPVLGYWVQAGSILLFGENSFAVRLPSAMAVGLSSLLIFVIVYRMRRNDDSEDDFAAIVAVLVFLSCAEVFAVGIFAVLDSLFSLFVTVSITAFYFASEEPARSGKGNRFLLLAGLSCGLAFLTKGFLAFAVPALALAPYLVWQRRPVDLLRMSWLPILVAMLVVLPWGILIQLREPGFWSFFFWNEHIRRFTADNAQHRESFGFFFVTAPGGFFPWSFMVPATVPALKSLMSEQSEQGRLTRLSLCWLVLPFLFLSFSNGKLLTYILPCFPPFAVLMAFGLSRVLEKEGKRTLFQWGIVANAVVLFLLLLAFLYVQVVGYDGVRPYNHPLKPVLAVIAVLFPVLLWVWAFKTRKRKHKILAFSVAPLFLFSVAPFIVPDPVNEHEAPGPLLEKHEQYLGDNDIVISDEYTVGAVCWYLQRSDVYVLGSAGELDYGFGYADAGGRLLDAHSAVDLINRNRGKTVVIAWNKKHPLWRDQLPKPVSRDDTGPTGYMFWRY